MYGLNDYIEEKKYYTEKMESSLKSLVRYLRNEDPSSDSKFILKLSRITGLTESECLDLFK